MGNLILATGSLVPEIASLASKKGSNIVAFETQETYQGV